MASRSSSSSSKTSRRCARPRERRFRARLVRAHTVLQFGGPLQRLSPTRSGGDPPSPPNCSRARNPSPRSPVSVQQPSRNAMETVRQDGGPGHPRSPAGPRADRPGPPNCDVAQPRPRGARRAAPCRPRSGCPDGYDSHELKAIEAARQAGVSWDGLGGLALASLAVLELLRGHA